MLVQTKHLMTAVWIQSSAILFTSELNKLFQKRQKIVILNYKTNISIILHLCHNHLILLFQSYDATDAKNQKLLPRPVVLHTFAYLELVILKVGCVSIFIRCREAITTTTTTAREGRNLWTVHCKQCDQIGWFIGLWATF